MADLAALDRLLAFEEIRQLKARYFRLLDTKDFTAFAGLFTDDFHYLDDAKQVDLDRDQFVAFIANRHRTSVSVHAGRDPELELDGADEAHGVWSMSDFVILPREGNARTVQQGSGHYHDQYRRVEARWLLARSRLSRLWLRVEQQDEEFTNVG